MTATVQNIEENEIDVDDYETKVKIFLCMMIFVSILSCVWG